MKSASIATAASLLVLVGCGGGGAGSSCQSIGSAPSYGTVVGGVENLDSAVDGKLSSFATLQSSVPGTFIGGGGRDFPAGSNAGLFITPPAGATVSDITVSTFTGTDTSVLESATGTGLTITRTSGDPATQYVSFVTNLPFSGVKMTINSSGDVQYLVYEVCGAASPR